MGITNKIPWIKFTFFTNDRVNVNFIFFLNDNIIFTEYRHRAITAEIIISLTDNGAKLPRLYWVRKSRISAIKVVLLNVIKNFLKLEIGNG